jgi:ribosomal protein S18 acetylase RimI-like enzyme
LFELFKKKITEMGCDEICLETECCNLAALRFYESGKFKIDLGFIKTKRLLNYYMNGNDAFRLMLWITLPPIE